MSAPAYESYKDSGVEWLGKVPSHWEVGPLKREFEVCLGKMLQTEAKGSSDEPLPYLRAANIQWNGVDVSEVKKMWASPQEVEKLQLEAGDLLVSEGGDVGRSTIWLGELKNCIFQNSVNRVRSFGRSNTKFLLFWISMLKSSGFVDIICNKATIAHFTAEKVASVPVYFPSPAEQTAIAAFLDRETGKIDALIEAQTRLIELLKEKRQAVISHAVTKGLNPDAPMKDSGIEWLGQVPAHWEVATAKRVADVYVPQRNKPTLNSEKQGLPWVTMENMGAMFVHSFKHWVAEEDARYAGSTVLPEGSVIASCVGNFGASSINSEPVIINQQLQAYTPNHMMLPAFLRYHVVIGSSYFERSATAATIPYVNQIGFGLFPIVIPPIDEQRLIIEHIISKDSNFIEMIATAETAISLIKERRAALISAAVTGKIDVRGLVNIQSEAA